ncbi:flagellar hook-length control protein FliK [Paenibacillus sp. P26]|nr:flagellar hook-length control protein FliK [Paenibacillus sp. P26]
MEIQTQTAAVTGTGTATAATGKAQQGSTAAGNFLSALAGMVAGGAAQGGANNSSAVSSLPILLQTLSPLISLLQSNPEQTPEPLAGQLDALLQQLNQSDDQLSQQLVDNPELQAWLAQLQAFLNPQLFVPIVSEEASVGLDKAGQAAGPVLKPAITKNQAVQLLQDVKQILLSGNKDAQTSAVDLVKRLPNLVQSIQSQVQQVAAVESEPTQAAVNVDSGLNDQPVHKVSNAGKRTRVNVTNSGTETKQAVIQTAASSVPSALQKLEALSAKSLAANLQPTSVAEQNTLFEPLDTKTETDLTGLANQAVPLHEFLRQAQSGHNVPKVPVLQVPAESFAKDAAAFVVNAFSLETTADGFSEAKISLFPQHLGQVDVKLTMHNGQLIAQFVADSAAGKEMLESQLAQLRTTLQNQGIQVERLEVTQSPSLQSGMFQEQRQQQSQQFTGKQQKSGAGKIAAIEEDFTEEPSALSEPAGASVKDNGSIDVTA